MYILISFDAHSPEVKSVTLSEDCRYLVSGSTDDQTEGHTHATSKSMTL